MTEVLTLERGAEAFISPEPLTLSCGGRLEGFRLGYELQGACGAPLVIVQGGISATSHVASSRNNPEPGWWDVVVGPDKPIDTARWRVLSTDFLGGESSDALPFPALTSHDQALAIGRLCDELGIARVHAFIGSSYGGMVGLAFASLFPGRLRHLVAISAPEASHPWATALRALQRRVLRFGIERGCTAEAVEIARGIGMVSYRSPEEFAERFDSTWRQDGKRIRFPVEGYLEACGRRHSKRVTAESYHALSLAIDLHRIDPSTIRVPSTIVGVASDQLVPFAQLERLAASLGGPARLVRIESLYGHDAFLKEVGQLAPILRDALEEVGA